MKEREETNGSRMFAKRERNIFIYHGKQRQRDKRERGMCQMKTRVLEMGKKE